MLADLGVKAIVLTTNHGHLFGEEVGDDMKIGAPGGDTADLHRRVWVGVVGTSEPSYLRTPLKVLGVGGDLDLATPYTPPASRSSRRRPSSVRRLAVACSRFWEPPRADVKTKVGLAGGQDPSAPRNP